MQISLHTLHRRWAWTSLCAIAALAVLGVIDNKLKAATGHGVIDLQRATNAAQVREVLASWDSPRRGALAGFSLGFDYLFMPLWGFALFFGSLAARERFAPRPGQLRRVMLFLAAVPLAGMVLDVAENALEFSWIYLGLTDQLVMIGSTVTSAKWLCVFVGLAVSLAGLVGLFVKPKAAA